MQQEDQTQQYEPSFDDANYDIMMRVDPLITMDEIHSELNQLAKNRADRKAAAEMEAERLQKEDEAIAKAQQEEQIESNRSAAKDETKS